MAAPCLSYRDPVLQPFLLTSDIDDVVRNVWRRVYAHTSDKPDAWYDTHTRRLYPCTKQPKGIPPEHLLPLTPGDVLKHHTRMLPMYKHVVLYIGFGLIVDFVPLTIPRTPMEVVLGSVRLWFLEEYVMCYEGTIKWEVCTPPHTSTSSRLRFIHAALCSIGTYKYSLAYFNCQHIVSRWCGGGCVSEGVTVSLRTALATSVGVGLALLLTQCAVTVISNTGPATHTPDGV